jgi:hypothetical protein
MLNFRQWLITELRSKSFFNRLKEKYSNIPAYVAKDTWSAQTGGDWKDDSGVRDTPGWLHEPRKILNEKRWKLETINLHWDILSEHTKKIIIIRKFGLINPYQVGEDENRFNKQRELHLKIVAGENEPIIMFYENGLYDLHEGYHRTMTYLLSSGGNPKLVLNKMINLSNTQMVNLVRSFRPIKIKAWVGH